MDIYFEEFIKDLDITSKPDNRKFKIR